MIASLKKILLTLILISVCMFGTNITSGTHTILLEYGYSAPSSDEQINIEFWTEEEFRLSLIVVIMLFFRFLLMKHLQSRRNGVFERLLSTNIALSLWYSDILNGIRVIKLWNLNKSNEYCEFIKKDQSENKKYNVLLLFEDLISSIIEVLLTYSVYFAGTIFIVCMKAGRISLRL